MDEGRSYWAWAVSSTLHGALLLILILGFASAPKFEDSQEAIPVETISETQLNQIMNGEKTAKPAPEPPPAPKSEPTPPTPPEPPPALRAAQEPTPTPSPPPKPEPPAPPKPEPAPPPKQADMPEPPERPKEPAQEKPKPKPDEIAKVVEREKTETKPPQRYDPNAIAKLIASKPSAASGAANPSNAPAAVPLGLPHHDAPRMSLSMASALDAWLTDSYLSCWTPPPAMPEGDVYVAEIKVVFNPDGSLSARPILLNPPTDAAWKAHAESAIRAVRKCDPLHVPPQYAPYFEEWKIETIHFDPRDTQG